jgi:hypothetical protein
MNKYTFFTKCLKLSIYLFLIIICIIKLVNLQNFLEIIYPCANAFVQSRILTHEVDMKFLTIILVYTFLNFI